jgi:hypothetical protein
MMPIVTAVRIDAANQRGIREQECPVCGAQPRQICARRETAEPPGNFSPYARNFSHLDRLRTAYGQPLSTPMCMDAIHSLTMRDRVTTNARA